MNVPHDAPVTVVAYALWPTPLPHPLAQALAQHQHLPVMQALAQAPLSTAMHLPPQSVGLAHEWAWALAMGCAAPAQHMPLAAWEAQRLKLACPDSHGWAFIDVVFSEFQQGQVKVHAPVGLDDATLTQLFDAMHPYVQEDGIEWFPCSQSRYLAHGEMFKSMPTLSLDRVSLKGLHALDDAAWLTPPSAAQRRWHRLQNEMQMLLYPLAPPTGLAQAMPSIWVSGCGDLPAQPSSSLTLLEALREPFLQADAVAWSQTWVELAHEHLWPSLQRGGEVWLCGVDHVRKLSPSNLSGVQRLWSRWFPPSLIQRLS